MAFNPDNRIVCLLYTSWVCPECGGRMGGRTKEFKCQGKCRTDWRDVWERRVGKPGKHPNSPQAQGKQFKDCLLYTSDHSLNVQESRSARPGLERESDRLKLLLDMTTTLVSTLECRELLRTVSASIRRVMHSDMVGVWLPDAEHVHLRQTAMDFPESKGFAKEDALQLRCV